MPMPSETNYQWWPNDNGSLTNHSYDLEAEKWVTALGHAQSKFAPGDYAADTKFIGNVIALPLLLIFLIFLIPIVLVKELIGYNIKIFPGDPATGWKDKRSDHEKFNDKMKELKAKYPPKKKRQTTWEDLTDEQQEMVTFIRSETAKAKAKMKGGTN